MQKEYSYVYTQKQNSNKTLLRHTMLQLAAVCPPVLYGRLCRFLQQKIKFGQFLPAPQHPTRRCRFKRCSRVLASLLSLSLGSNMVDAARRSVIRRPLARIGRVCDVPRRSLVHRRRGRRRGSRRYIARHNKARRRRKIPRLGRIRR